MRTANLLSLFFSSACLFQQAFGETCLFNTGSGTAELLIEDPRCDSLSQNATAGPALGVISLDHLMDSSDPDKHLTDAIVFNVSDATEKSPSDGKKGLKFATEDIGGKIHHIDCWGYDLHSLAIDCKKKVSMEFCRPPPADIWCNYKKVILFDITGFFGGLGVLAGLKIRLAKFGGEPPPAVKDWYKKAKEDGAFEKYLTNTGYHWQTKDKKQMKDFAGHNWQDAPRSKYRYGFLKDQPSVENTLEAMKAQNEAHLADVSGTEGSDLSASEEPDNAPGKESDIAPGDEWKHERSREPWWGQIGENSDVAPGKESDIPAGKEPDIAPGKEPDIAPDKELDIPLRKESDISLGKESDISLGKESDIPFGKESDIPAGKESGISADKESDILAGKESDVPADRKSDTPPSKESEIRTGKESDILSGKESEIPPVEGSEIPADKESDILASKESGIPADKESDTLAGKESDMPAGKESEVPLGKESDILPSKDLDIPADRESDIPADKELDMPAGKESEIPLSKESDILPGKESDVERGREPWMDRKGEKSDFAPPGDEWKHETSREPWMDQKGEKSDFAPPGDEWKHETSREPWIDQKGKKTDIAPGTGSKHETSRYPWDRIREKSDASRNPEVNRIGEKSSAPGAGSKYERTRKFWDQIGEKPDAPRNPRMNRIGEKPDVAPGAGSKYEKTRKFWVDRIKEETAPHAGEEIRTFDGAADIEPPIGHDIPESSREGSQLVEKVAGDANPPETIIANLEQDVPNAEKYLKNLQQEGQKVRFASVDDISPADFAGEKFPKRISSPSEIIEAIHDGTIDPEKLSKALARKFPKAKIIQFENLPPGPFRKPFPPVKQGLSEEELKALKPPRRKFWGSPEPKRAKFVVTQHKKDVDHPHQSQKKYWEGRRKQRQDLLKQYGPPKDTTPKPERILEDPTPAQLAKVKKVRLGHLPTDIHDELLGYRDPTPERPYLASNDETSEISKHTQEEPQGLLDGNDGELAPERHPEDAPVQAPKQAPDEIPESSAAEEAVGSNWKGKGRKLDVLEQAPGQASAPALEEAPEHAPEQVSKQAPEVGEAQDPFGTSWKGKDKPVDTLPLQEEQAHPSTVEHSQIQTPHSDGNSWSSKLKDKSSRLKDKFSKLKAKPSNLKEKFSMWKNGPPEPVKDWSPNTMPEGLSEQLGAKATRYLEAHPEMPKHLQYTPAGNNFDQIPAYYQLYSPYDLGRVNKVPPTLSEGWERFDLSEYHPGGFKEYPKDFPFSEAINYRILRLRQMQEVAMHQELEKGIDLVFENKKHSYAPKNSFDEDEHYTQREVLENFEYDDMFRRYPKRKMHYKGQPTLKRWKPFKDRVKPKLRRFERLPWEDRAILPGPKDLKEYYANLYPHPEMDPKAEKFIKKEYLKKIKTKTWLNPWDFDKDDALIGLKPFQRFTEKQIDKLEEVLRNEAIEKEEQLMQKLYDGFDEDWKYVKYERAKARMKHYRELQMPYIEDLAFQANDAYDFRVQEARLKPHRPALDEPTEPGNEASGDTAEKDLASDELAVGKTEQEAVKLQAEDPGLGNSAGPDRELAQATHNDAKAEEVLAATRNRPPKSVGWDIFPYDGAADVPGEPAKAPSPEVEPPNAPPSDVESPEAPPPQIEPQNAASPHVEDPKAPPPQVEAPKAPPPHVEAPEAAIPHVEAPKAPPPHVEAPKAALPHVEPPKAPLPHIEPPMRPLPPIKPAAGPPKLSGSDFAALMNGNIDPVKVLSGAESRLSPAKLLGLKHELSKDEIRSMGRKFNAEREAMRTGKLSGSAQREILGKYGMDEASWVDLDMWMQKFRNVENLGALPAGIRYFTEYEGSGIMSRLSGLWGKLGEKVPGLSMDLPLQVMFVASAAISVIAEEKAAGRMKRDLEYMPAQPTTLVTATSTSLFTLPTEFWTSKRAEDTQERDLVQQVIRSRHRPSRSRGMQTSVPTQTVAS